MHIPDGFLSAGVTITTGVISAGAIGLAITKARNELDEKAVPLLALCTAFVFAAQMLNFPVAGGTSGHFLGGVLAVVLLGPWMGSLVIGLVLLVQCFGFADGGVTALGANVFNMAVIGAMVGFLIYSALKRILPFNRKFFLLSAGAAAWLSVVLAATAASFELAISGTTPLSVTLPAMLGVHAIIGLGEAVITMLVLAVVLAARPDLIRTYDYRPSIVELDEYEDEAVS
jgi:cobalt/nickel transport system permease protein